MTLAFQPVRAWVLAINSIWLRMLSAVVMRCEPKIEAPSLGDGKPAVVDLLGSPRELPPWVGRAGPKRAQDDTGTESRICRHGRSPNVGFDSRAAERTTSSYVRCM